MATNPLDPIEVGQAHQEPAYMKMLELRSYENHPYLLLALVSEKTMRSRDRIFKLRKVLAAFAALSVVVSLAYIHK